MDRKLIIGAGQTIDTSTPITMNALDYHATTKHSWARINADPHFLDFENMPHPFKIYADLARESLPRG